VATVRANLAFVKVRGADGVKRERGLTACCNVTRGKNNLLHDLSGMLEPSTIKAVLKQQSVWEMHHSQVVERMRRVPFKGR